MSKEKIKRIHLIYGCITAALVVLVAAALIVTCVNIYQSGDRPYSREVVSQALQQLALPGWLCLAAVVGGIILNAVLPLQETPKAIRSDREMLERLHSRDIPLNESEIRSASKERKLRRTGRIITAVVIALLMIHPTLYLLDIRNFTIENLNQDIVRAVIVVLTPAMLALVLTYLYCRLENASIRREIAIYKAHPGKPAKKECKPANNHTMVIIRCAGLAVAVVFIILGVVNGGISDVLGKAIRICTECIGLG